MRAGRDTSRTTLLVARTFKKSMTISAVDLGSMVTSSSSGASRWRIASNGVAMLHADWTGQDPPISRMPRPDRVSVITTHSMMHWPKWVGLIARSTGSAFVLFALSNRPHHAGCRRDPFQTLSPVALTPGHKDPRNPHNLVGQLR
jgi:hypothetical protein